MPFATGLRESLKFREEQVPSEFDRGDALEDVLDRHLLAVERMSQTEILTSILLLSGDGRLSHGAAPSLPRAYRDAIDGCEIGPSAGSCGTAAYFGHPVYVTDIATDQLWADYRHLALPHGLRSCWSSPIRDKSGTVIGTFAIYHRTATGPTREEVDAIDLITDHVANAIMWSREVQGLQRKRWPPLELVADESVPNDHWSWSHRLRLHLDRLESLAADMVQRAAAAKSEDLRVRLNAAASDSRRLISTIRHHIGLRNAR